MLLSPVMRGEVSPWSRLNLRRNPFGEPPLDVVGDLIVLSNEAELLDWLAKPRAVLQFLGEAGRGKTARLRLLQRRFRGAPYVYLAEDEPLPSLPRLEARPGGGPALLLDEAQRLPRRRRRRLFREARRTGATLVLASHEDLTDELRAKGLVSRTITVSGLDEDLLLEIVSRRLERARAGDGSLPVMSRAIARDLVEQYGDDLRSLLDQLYEDYQNMLRSSEKETQWRNVI
ncbi:MAG: hypothetical protein KY459_00285 [Acidobacteria bacterium]|nr:hypothetical protein [Acidobacteriota bacterium]